MGSDKTGRSAFLAGALAAVVWLGATALPPLVRAQLLRSALRPRGDPGRVAALIRQGAAPDTVNAAGLTPLMWAAREGHSELVRELLDAGADLTRTDASGRTALVHAVRGGSLKAAAMLAAPRTPPVLRDTALVHAVLSDNPRMTELLLSAGADPNARVELHGGTALMVAVGRKNVRLTRLLLAWGADPEVANSAGESALSLARTLRWTKATAKSAALDRAGASDREILQALIESRRKVPGAAGRAPRSSPHPPSTALQ